MITARILLVGGKGFNEYPVEKVDVDFHRGVTSLMFKENDLLWETQINHSDIVEMYVYDDGGKDIEKRVFGNRHLNKILAEEKVLMFQGEPVAISPSIIKFYVLHKGESYKFANHREAYECYQKYDKGEFVTLGYFDGKRLHILEEKQEWK